MCKVGYIEENEKSAETLKYCFLVGKGVEDWQKYLNAMSNSINSWESLKKDLGEKEISQRRSQSGPHLDIEEAYKEVYTLSDT